MERRRYGCRQPRRAVRLFWPRPKKEKGNRKAALVSWQESARRIRRKPSYVIQGTKSDAHVVMSSRKTRGLKIWIRRRDRRAGDVHHPAIELDAMPVGIEKIEGVAAAAAGEPTWRQSLRRMHQRTVD